MVSNDGNAAAGERAVTTPQRILVGYDGSAEAETALRWGVSLAVALGATIRVVHAVGLLEHAGLTPVAAHEERARVVTVEAGLDANHFE